MHRSSQSNSGFSPIVPVDFDEIRDLVSRLPRHQQVELAEGVLGSQRSSTFILGGTNMINNGFASSSFSFQSGNANGVFEHLKDYSKEEIEEVIRAVAMWFAQYKASSYQPGKPGDCDCL